MGRLQTKPEVFVSGSAIGWYGVHDTATFTEETGMSTQNGGVFAQQVCRDWENLASQAEGLGVRTVLLRTGIVLEKDGGTLAALLFPFDFGFGGPIASGKQWFSWIHRDDLIGLILHVIADDGMRGFMNGTAPEPVTNEAFSRALGSAMRRPSLIPLPGFVLQIVFGQMADELMLSGQKILPQRAMASGYVFRYPDIRSAMQAIFSA